MITFQINIAIKRKKKKKITYKFYSSQNLSLSDRVIILM